MTSVLVPSSFGSESASGVDPPAVLGAAAAPRAALLILLAATRERVASSVPGQTDWRRICGHGYWPTAGLSSWFRWP